MIRSLIEKWSRGIVLKRKLPPEFEHRTIFVSPEAGGLRYWRYDMRKIDPMLEQVVRQFIKPNFTVWDIGGNVGFFSLMCASKAKPGKVIVFEPDIMLCNILHKTVMANADLDIQILPMAVSDKDGFARFHIAERSRSTNYLSEAFGSSQTGGVRLTTQVPTIAIDTIAKHFPTPDFIKIDVEGAEHLVFNGMTNLLQHTKPIILCEYSDNTAAHIIEILRKVNYTVYDAKYLPDMIPCSANSDNLIAIPSRNGK